MKIAVFNTKSYTEKYFTAANVGFDHNLTFFEQRLNSDTINLTQGFDAMCVFVNDDINADVLESAAKNGIKIVALRSAGFNNVDVNTAQKLAIKVVRVPSYSPNAVAEHTIALILALNRRIHKAHERIRQGNFSLDGLMGFELNNHTVGIVGTGLIGSVVAKILNGFGSKIYAYDPNPNDFCKDLGVEYVTFEKLLEQSYIITLHCPLITQTYHLIDQNTINKMRQCVMLINTGRGALIDTKAVIEGLKSGKIGYLGLDVYEEEEGLFFEDRSEKIIQDDIFARLLIFPNVIVTGHQAFFTNKALEKIAKTTLQNVTDIENSGHCKNEIKLELTPK